MPRRRAPVEGESCPTEADWVPNPAMASKPVVLIGGPTASGKSDLALSLAGASGGRVINADALQVYSDLSILSARPSAEETTEIPHALYGVLDGSDRCSAARWRDMALDAVDDTGDALPILVGGTGLYFKALTDGLADIPSVPDAVRAEAMAIAETEGVPALHQLLSVLDPDLAARLDPTDRQRVVRGWEVATATGIPLSRWQAKPRIPPPSRLRFITVRLMPERDRLYERCDRRFGRMVAEGGLDEIDALMERGLDPSLPIMKAVGVPELLAHRRGDVALEEAIAAGRQSTRRYAKRQLTWFRNQWPQPTMTIAETTPIAPIIAQLLEKCAAAADQNCSFAVDQSKHPD